MTRNPPEVARLVEKGLTHRARPPLTDAQVLLERIDEAMLPGTAVVFRRRVLAEAGAFIREHLATADRSAA
jgi:hypothetical protein